APGGRSSALSSRPALPPMSTAKSICGSRASWPTTSLRPWTTRCSASASVAETVRPVMDFDVMGVALLSPSGRDVDVMAEVNPGDLEIPATPPRMPVDSFSIPGRVLGGEPVLVHDAAIELDPSLAGDRMIID